MYPWKSFVLLSERKTLFAVKTISLHIYDCPHVVVIMHIEVFWQGQVCCFFFRFLWTAVISGMMWAFFVHSTAMDVLHLVHICHLTNQCCSVVIYSVFYKSSEYLCLGMKYCCSVWETLFCTRGSAHFFVILLVSLWTL